MTACHKVDLVFDVNLNAELADMYHTGGLDLEVIAYLTGKEQVAKTTPFHEDFIPQKPVRLVYSLPKAGTTQDPPC